MPKLTKKASPPVMHPTRVGRRIVQLREALGLLPAQMADALSCDRSAWSKYEKGERLLPTEFALRAAERFDVTMDYFYRGRLNQMPDQLRERLANRDLES